jgi:DNA-binding NarL/FixJ family response regulator
MLVRRMETSDTETLSNGVENDAQPLKVLLIDSHPLFADALASELRRGWPGTDCVQAASLEVGLRSLRSEPFDVVVANSESLNGQLEQLVRAAALARVVVTTDRIEHDKALQALALGVRAYLPKTMAGRAIIGAISVVLGGGTCVPSQDIASAVARASARIPRSRRESEILAHLARGASNKIIARELGLSVATVKLHVQAILRSTNARNRVEAIANARRMGMLSC